MTSLIKDGELAAFRIDLLDHGYLKLVESWGSKAACGVQVPDPVYMTSNRKDVTCAKCAKKMKKGDER